MQIAYSDTLKHPLLWFIGLSQGVPLASRQHTPVGSVTEVILARARGRGEQNSSEVHSTLPILRQGIAGENASGF